MNNCSFCHTTHLYLLRNGHIKCAQCKRKFSPKKYERDKKIIQSFCNNTNALQASKLHNLNYVTVQKRYQNLRRLITTYLDNEHHKDSMLSQEYDEYIYMKNENIYAAQNFLTFNYHNRIYNLMLPSLYKFRTFDKNDEELSKFLFLNKIAKLESKYGKINEFWEYLEEFLKPYKGVNSENFVYYLKEAEFKFNYDKKVQEEILLKLYFV